MASTLYLVVVIYLIGNTLADTKILANLKLFEPAGSLVDEVISLNNPGTVDEELVKEGVIVIRFPQTELAPHAYTLVIEYRADKTGYHAKYNITKLPLYYAKNRLGVNALKSSAG